MDILYLGVNMGNCSGRFFPRYPGAEGDYYQNFYWLDKFANEHPKRKVVIKHHGGNYNIHSDRKEMAITENSNIIYADNQANSYQLALQAKMLVSYCSTMILEVSGYPNLAYFIRETRMQKRYLFRRPCKRPRSLWEDRLIKGNYPPAFFLDPGHRNRQFCKNIDDICIHDCSFCPRSFLEIYEPFRLCSYREFEDVAEICCSRKNELD